MSRTQKRSRQQLLSTCCEEYCQTSQWRDLINFFRRLHSSTRYFLLFPHSLSCLSLKVKFVCQTKSFYFIVLLYSVICSFIVNHNFQWAELLWCDWRVTERITLLSRLCWNQYKDQSFCSKQMCQTLVYNPNFKLVIVS